MALRRPKNERVGWTDRELRAIPATWKGDRLADGGGLVGDVRASSEGRVSVRFQYGFRFGGKAGLLFQCGSWPALSLLDIRKQRDWAREQVKAGLDPRTARAAAKVEAQAERAAVVQAAQQAQDQEKTVANLFDLWIKDGVARKDENAELRRSFAADVLPAIGQIAVEKLTETDVRNVLKVMRARGVIRSMIIVHAALVQMFAWAEKRQPWRRLLVDGNPVAIVDMKTLIPKSYKEERTRVLSDAELAELAAIFARLRTDYAAAPAGTKYATARPLARTTELAVWLCLGTLCRVGEVLAAEWRHIDFKNSTWLIPAENAKTDEPHAIFFSNFVRARLESLRELTGASRWLFPASNKDEGHVCQKTVSKQIGDRQAMFSSRKKALSRRVSDDSLVLVRGENGNWTPHDLRRTGATLMQKLKVDLNIIDRCQNHVLAGSRVRRHYLFHEYADEKRDAWERLGVYLQSVLPTNL